MSGSTTHTDETTEKAWTVFGTYRDEEFADGGILEGDFAGILYAPTAEEAELSAHEYDPWLDWDSVSVIPGAVEGIPHLTPESQMPESAP
ncbi:MAG TPA: hypothetical protein VGH58_01315 [Solirubrobacterales bacterium]|jgi:hypothetical protein